MAWVSGKVYAILSSSEEGKDIIQKLPELTQEEASKEIDAFFGEGGKGASSSNDYLQAKSDDEAEENAYKAMLEEDASDKDLEQDVSEEEISEHLADYEWSITENTTAGQYAQECADRLGCSKEQVFAVLKKQAPEEITEDSKMASLMEGEEDKIEYAIEKDDGTISFNGQTFPDIESFVEVYGENSRKYIKGK